MREGIPHRLHLPYAQLDQIFSRSLEVAPAAARMPFLSGNGRPGSRRFHIGLEQEVDMKRSVRGTLVRSFAATALVLLYGLGIVGVSSLTGATPAQARRGGRGGGGRGFRGRGFRGGVFIGAPYGYYGYDDGCFWSPRRQRWICPYYYRPYPYW